MRIPCPHCGTRDSQEFSYLGAADLDRPDGLDASTQAMTDYVYLRDNPCGPHREYWYHAAGCRTWLTVTRNTRTHEITRVESGRVRTGEAA